MARMGLRNAQQEIAKESLKSVRALMAKLAKEPGAPARPAGDDFTRFLDLLGRHTAASLAADSRRQTDAVINAAALVFAHAILDDVTLNLCQLSALRSPADWDRALAGKKYRLRDLRGASYKRLRRQALDAHLKTLSRAPLMHKTKIVLSRFPLSNRRDLVRGFSMDQLRLEQLDRLRHTIVHGPNPISRIRVRADDIAYLSSMAFFLLRLVGEHCAFSKNVMRAAHTPRT